ncbi:MAG: serine acetyltransferase [Kiritimatiellae bacterium]|nr:serine acetyltransferase [Kiritimatiellia bacterium]
MDKWLDSRLDTLTAALERAAGPEAGAVRAADLPGQRAIIDTLERFIGILFPGCHGPDGGPDNCASADCVRERIADAATRLTDQVEAAFEYAVADKPRARAEEAVAALLDALPSIRATLEEDVVAAYEGDPAATSTVEVVLSYPGFFAIVVHRIAHVLYTCGVPIIPRVMSEYAHSKTGIDIHPGATIGPGFFIDHGTGVVIGETCTIGRHVKLYQGVTLGARSFPKNEDGTLVKGLKRHPDVEDDVVIYAGATVLGGETVIGRGAVIGASVWITFSVPAGAHVMK